MAAQCQRLDREMRKNAAAPPREPFIDVRPLVEMIGLAEFLRQVGVRQIIEAIGLDAIAAALTPAQREAFVNRCLALQGGKGQSKKRIQPKADHGRG